MRYVEGGFIMEKFTFQLPVFQAIHFMVFLDKIEIPYKMHSEPGKKLTLVSIIYFDMVLNDMNFIRVSRALDFICNSKTLMP